MIRKLVNTNEHAMSTLGEEDRETMASFLSAMEGDLGEVHAQEKAAIKAFEELKAAKLAEIEAATKAIEAKLQRLGELSVEIVQMKNDLEDTQEALGEDVKFLMDLQKNCDEKKKEWAVRTKTRSEELLALADVIKLLSHDDALELFKKTLPSAS